jgi:hypothetical protein
MPRMEFEPTIPVFERVRTVHALDRAATVIGQKYITGYNITVSHFIKTQRKL